LNTKRPERRLAAVLALEVAGYSRLMGADEEGTLARLKALRKTLVDPSIAAHRGRIVKTTGDGMLVEFASAVDAARSAIEVQRGMAERNVGVQQQIRLEFRISIHVGDVIIDKNDIFGDGVNIASRLEGVAEPGGVCISDDAQRQIRGKISIAFGDMGPQVLKNIAEPMRSWRLLLGESASSLRSEKPTSEPARAAALLGFTMNAIAAAFGTISRNSPKRFGPSSTVNTLIPVRFLSGRLKLVARPCPTGSIPVRNTTGMVVVALAAASEDGRSVATSTETFLRTRSAASAGRRASCPSEWRNSIATFCPISYPASSSPLRNAGSSGASDFEERLLK
jgi:class 3 adenylate cyclase